LTIQKNELFFVLLSNKIKEAQMISKTGRKLTYQTALLLSISTRKTFEALAREVSSSGDVMSRLVERYAATLQDLIKIVTELSQTT
jgi:hypothetical protein